MSGDRLSPEARARALPILREAFDVIEHLDDPARRDARAQMGTYLRQLGLADQFENYGAPEIQAAYASRSPDWHAALMALTRIEAEAKGRLLIGDIVGAEMIYAPAHNLRAELFRDSASGDFLDWLVEIGDYESALKVVDSPPEPHGKWHAEQRAEILLQAGRRAAALDFLAKRGAEAKAAGDIELLLVVADWLATAKEPGQARVVLRAAAASALAAVSDDVERPLADRYSEGLTPYDTTPVSIAQFQCRIGDGEGAATTLTSVLRLGPSVTEEEKRRRQDEYDSWTARLRGAAGSGKRMLLPPHNIEVLESRAAERWREAGPELARALARAGLESDLQSLLTSRLDQRSALLAGVIKGSAERGAFATAFATMQLRQDVVPPDERESSFGSDMTEVAGIAARLGNVEAFRRAISALRERFPNDRLLVDGLYCTDLAKAGKVDAALQCVRLVEPVDRYAELLHIIASITEIPVYRPSAPQIRYFAP